MGENRLADKASKRVLLSLLAGVAFATFSSAIYAEAAVEDTPPDYKISSQISDNSKGYIGDSPYADRRQKLEARHAKPPVRRRPMRFSNGAALPQMPSFEPLGALEESDPIVSVEPAIPAESELVPVVPQIPVTQPAEMTQPVIEEIVPQQAMPLPVSSETEMKSVAMPEESQLPSILDDMSLLEGDDALQVPAVEVVAPKMVEPVIEKPAMTPPVMAVEKVPEVKVVEKAAPQKGQPASFVDGILSIFDGEEEVVQKPKIKPALALPKKIEAKPQDLTKPAPIRTPMPKMAPPLKSVVIEKAPEEHSSIERTRQIVQPPEMRRLVKGNVAPIPPLILTQERFSENLTMPEPPAQVATAAPQEIVSKPISQAELPPILTTPKVEEKKPAAIAKAAEAEELPAVVSASPLQEITEVVEVAAMPEVAVSEVVSPTSPIPTEAPVSALAAISEELAEKTVAAVSESVEEVKPPAVKEIVTAELRTEEVASLQVADLQKITDVVEVPEVPVAAFSEESEKAKEVKIVLSESVLKMQKKSAEAAKPAEQSTQLSQMKQTLEKTLAWVDEKIHSNQQKEAEAVSDQPKEMEVAVKQEPKAAVISSAKKPRKSAVIVQPVRSNKPFARFDKANVVVEEAVEISEDSKVMLKNFPSKLNAPKVKRFDEEVKISRASVPDLEMSKPEIKKHEALGISIEVKKPNLDVNDYLVMAYEAAQNNELILALQYYQKILENYPDNNDAILGLATVNHRLGDTEYARKLYRKLLTEAPRNTEVLNNFLVLVSEESPEKAIEELLYLEGKNPHYDVLPAQLAAIYANQGQLEQAIMKMVRAIEINPEHLLYRYNLAVMLDHAGQRKQAIQAYSMVKKAFEKGDEIPTDISHIQERLTFLLSNRSS